MIHFLTCVCNGMPFIRHHLKVFESLSVPWHWHICEGASYTHDGAPAPRTACHGLSDDGTHEYLVDLAKHPQVTITQDTRHYLTWRFNEMLKTITGECLLWQVDVDEYWTAKQIETMHDLFANDHSVNSAMCWCNYFVGPRLVLERKRGAGNFTNQEWRRVWRFKEGCAYVQHDPPIITPANSPAFTHAQTEAAGLIFNHYAFVTEKQVEFKTRRYGWTVALDRWRALQGAVVPTPVEKFLPWLGCGTVMAAQESDGFRED